MAVPRMVELGRGVGVNIVLKADQRTGRLTTGHIADILTRGDHPRGIKVRLTTGQIGRVQSLAEGSAMQQPDILAQSSNELHTVPAQNRSNYQNRSQRHQRRGGRETYEEAPGSRSNTTSSLFDYVQERRQPRIRGGIGRSYEPQPDPSAQELLEADFPNIDPALIAAIVADYPNKNEAKTVLSSLS